MKILVIEDQFKEIKGLLDYVNFKFFDNTLIFENVRCTQEIKNFNELDEYDLIIVDIQLDLRSENDGTSFVKKILTYDKNKNIFFITGLRDGITKKLDEYGLSDIQVIKKPLDDEQLASIIKSF